MVFFVSNKSNVSFSTKNNNIVSFFFIVFLVYHERLKE